MRSWWHQPAGPVAFVVVAGALLLPCLVDTGPLYPPLIPHPRKEKTMTEQMTPPKPKQPTAVKSEDGPRAVRRLQFRGGTDIPTQSGAAQIFAGERTDDKPSYEITFVPRLGGYMVRAFQRPNAGAEPKLKHEFFVARELAVADFELTP